jgi:hypothetical protein
MEDLIKQFENLTDEEKVEFFKRIFPSAFHTFKNNPQQLISEVLPIVMKEFKESGIDLAQLASMASMFS